MRVAIVNQFYVPDIAPTAHMAAGLAEHLADRGDTVTVIASRGGYVASSRYRQQSEVKSNPRVHRIWTPRLGKARLPARLAGYICFYLLSAWRALRLQRQDVFVCLTTPPFIAWVAVLHRLLHPGTKILLWNMDCYPEAAERFGVIRENGAISRTLRWLNYRLFRQLDHVVSLDSAMAELLSGYAPASDPPAFSVIPNWEKLSLFPPPQPGQFQQDFMADVIDGKFVVLYLGNAGYGHDFATLLQAANRLRHDPIAFLFVGGGSKIPEIQKQRDVLELDNVVMCDYVQKEQTPAVMASADCALITLKDQAAGVISPSKLHANLAMGLPVLYIGPAQGNVDDAIAGHDCGASLRHGDVDGVVAYLRTLMGNPQRLSEQCHNARTAFEQAYCDRATLPQFEAILDRLGADNRDPAVRM